MTGPVNAGYSYPGQPHSKTDPLANRGHWGAGLLLLLGVLVPVLYYAAAYGLRSTRPGATEELLPMPREESALSEPEERLLNLINEARAKDPKTPPLKPDPTLFRVARDHAANMAKHRKPSEELDGKDNAARVQEAGYKAQPGRLESNHVSSPTLTPEEISRSWMDAPQIKAQMLDAHFTDTGIGIARGEDGVVYCCQILAAPQK